MTSPGNTDYAAVYFKYSTPTPITGEPSNKSLKRLKTELRANASSVDTDLGGGDHGYLGLILTDVEYARITPTPSPFVAPNFPGPLVIDSSLNAVQQVQARETHNERLALYRECKNVEKALLRHIQSAVDDKYIEFMIDEDTGLIEEDVPTVLEYLFTTYGKVTAEEVKDEENLVLNISFNPADPMVTIFRPIEQLQKKAISAGIKYSVEQLLEMGLSLIRNTRDFEKALGEWNQKIPTDKTWDNFKSHFRAAQVELKEIRGPTMLQAGYHHANMLAQQMRDDMTNQQTEMLAMMQTLVAPEQEPPSESEVAPQPAANAVVNDIQLQMLQILQAIQAAQQNGPNNQTGRSGGNNNRQTTNNGGNNGDGNGGRRRRNRRTPDDASFARQDTSHYCHTHGACNHDSNACNSRAPGHHNEATLANRMGGSNAFCN